jgi:hypothetical protein
VAATGGPVVNVTILESQVWTPSGGVAQSDVRSKKRSRLVASKCGPELTKSLGI